MLPFFKRPDQFEAFRIKAGESNRLVVMFDSIKEKLDFIACVEIFDEGGLTPPNTHKAADELFFVLEGEGRARCDDNWVELRKGDAMVVPAGAEHVVENTGPGRLYTLTVMVPDEHFAELIRNGVPDQLDQEDLRVLQGVGA
ncbi:cupin domain-containing protein [Alloalcanivorax gelatiniphagus]|uniref:Cupin domain-containing protein n=1 Tax=Alloalcanivorax gelatiniphagus TaxID=1194167 RepID=A0ABY2XSZ5_9GAMM|nr:cupin domain-containing protein [Alloalcanivorax gelatiniphagus]TMW15279.1 cupin domain-containing protein [Alloalcanivorax gelatiniphagus]|tara:strand:- start:23439 stop:23864 length:426 start_codon:yes stop_codon:yes gene_type:complete